MIRRRTSVGIIAASLLTIYSQPLQVSIPSRSVHHSTLQETCDSAEVVIEQYAELYNHDCVRTDNPREDCSYRLGKLQEYVTTYNENCPNAVLGVSFD